MQTEPKIGAILARLPADVFNILIGDIPARDWLDIFKENHNARKAVLEGFSLKEKSVERALSLPAVIAKVRRRLVADMEFLDQVILAWADESTVAGFLGMLDADYVFARWRQLRDMLGPERFCIGLLFLGAFEDEAFEALLDKEDFWSRAPDRTMMELLLLPMAVWGKFFNENPRIAAQIMEEIDIDLRSALMPDDDHHALPAEEEEPPAGFEAQPGEPPKKLDKKLERTLGELKNAEEHLARVKEENTQLRKKLNEWETEFNGKVADSAASLRSEWFSRYRGLDAAEISGEAARLESVLGRTRRALELQGKADREFGLISDIRARLLEIDLALARIESVYANSMVVHGEVEKVKASLLEEKKRILRLPGIRKVTGGAPPTGEGEFEGRINLMDPVPANLPRLSRLRDAIGALLDAGIVEDTAGIEEAILHKKKQVLEGLYSRFEPHGEALRREKSFRTLDEFIASGESRRYEVFVDGYNVLLRVLGRDEEPALKGLAEERERFIEAVIGKSARFARILLFFDGIEDSRDIRGNTEIIYTDKKRRSADAAIIDRVQSRAGKDILLVTADEEIISTLRKRIFALIDPIDFYMFVFE